MEGVQKKRDFTSGKVLKNLILFAIPMAIATLMQMLFNAADIAIVGNFGGSIYQAAVGATSSTVHLIVNFFVGLSLGANVVMANAYGAKDDEKQQRVVHTGMATALVSGALILVIGLCLSKPLLVLIGTPENIIDYSVTYMQIYFIGAPAMMLYNFGASIMRAVGETKKPLYYLLVAGILNVIINFVTVYFFNLHVIGVALGTTVSQCVSAVWILYDLSKAHGGERLDFKKIRFHKEEAKRILIIGAPMGISSCMFSLSNLSVQSAINAYGDMAIAGNTVASNIEAIGDAFGSSVSNACVTFVGQNLGAKKPERVHRIIGATLAAGATALACFSLLLLTVGEYFCMLFNTDPVVIEWALKRLHLVGVSWTLVSIMNAYGAALRGMGYSIFPMLINLVFTCVFRVIYVLFVYSQFPVKSIEQLYILYPITWILSGVAQLISYYVLGKKEGHFKKKQTE